MMITMYADRRQLLQRTAQSHLRLARTEQPVRQAPVVDAARWRQRCLGNQQLCALAGARLPLQAKLSVSQPGDVYEQEAERVAEQVVRAPDGVSRQGESSRSFNTRVRSPLFEETVTQLNTVEGEVRGRRLTTKEEALARSVFRASIDYSRVRLIPTKILPLRAIGNYIRVPVDFDIEDPGSAQTLVHELTHVWQYQHYGTEYISNALFNMIAAQWQRGSWLHAYDYQIGPEQSFFDFTAEQQARIVENYSAMVSGRDKAREGYDKELTAHERLIQQVRAALPRSEVDILLHRASGVMMTQPRKEAAPIPQELELTPIKPILQIQFLRSHDGSQDVAAGDIDATREEKQQWPPVVNEVLHSAGQKLSDATRAFMEPRFRYDFGTVQVQASPRAAEAAQAVGALAFTVGKHIVFAAGQYQPTTVTGQRLLAHELTHVIQQSKGLHRQAAHSESRSQTTAWDLLSDDAQNVLEYSFLTRNDNEWIWQDHQTAADCFNRRLPGEHQNAFREVSGALMEQALWAFVERVSEVYSGNVRGIKFEHRFRKMLTRVLMHNPNFCRDTFVGAPFVEAPKWRQVVAAGSIGLHITVPTTGLCDAHLDTITPVEGREANGECNYSIYHGIRHIWRDRWGL